MKKWLMALIILVMLIKAFLPVQAFAAADVLHRLWENDLTMCEGADCVEVATGTYLRNGVEKPFTLLRRSLKGNAGADRTAVNLGFTHPRGDKYIVISTFHPQLDMVDTRQVALLPDIDPDRPRGVSLSIYEELRETNLSPLFLTLSLYLAKKYKEIHHGEEVQTIVDEKARHVLPHKIYLRVEERDGHVAPVEVRMYRDGVGIICTIRMKNAMANGRLRPFWISLNSREKTDIIFVRSWGMVKNDPEFFTPTGLGRGDVSIPSILSHVSCPETICLAVSSPSK